MEIYIFFYTNGFNFLIMSHICVYSLTRLIFYLVQMLFVFNLLNFRYFNEKLTGEKRIKEPNSGGMAQEEKPAGREREGKKRRTAAQVHDSFNSKMQCQIKYFLSALQMWYPFLLNWGLFVNNSSIGTQQFNNHTSRVYTVSFTSSMLKHRKSSFFFI